MDNLTNEQRVQEEEFIFPYHYLSLLGGSYPNIEQLSILRVIKETIAPFKGQQLLDAGCGDGRFCYELRNENITVTGVDYSEKALGFARAFNPSVRFYQADLCNLHFKNEYDIITLIEVLEHVEPEKVEKVISSLWEALRDNGCLIVSVPSINMKLISKHYQHFTMEKLIELFAPKFKPIKKTGHTNNKRIGNHYRRLRKMCKLLWPWRNKLPCIIRFGDYVEQYYIRKVECCRPEDARRLIVMFKKNTLH